jgi:hypothetical protein
MSEIRNPPKHVWWMCHACGASNGPHDTQFCNMCGRNKKDVVDAERWHRFFTADATIVTANANVTTETQHRCACGGHDD